MTKLIGEICANCKWWDELSAYTGICRRYPLTERSNWPSPSMALTGSHEWCGEWTKPKAAP